MSNAATIAQRPNARTPRAFRPTVRSASAPMWAGYDVCPEAKAYGMPVGLYGAIAEDGTIHATGEIARAWTAARNVLKGGE